MKYNYCGELYIFFLEPFLSFHRSLILDRETSLISIHPGWTCSYKLAIQIAVVLMEE